jgi:hypothetical protein
VILREWCRGTMGGPGPLANLTPRQLWVLLDIPLPGEVETITTFEGLTAYNARRAAEREHERLTWEARAHGL